MSNERLAHKLALVYKDLELLKVELKASEIAQYNKIKSPENCITFALFYVRDAISSLKDSSTFPEVTEQRTTA